MRHIRLVSLLITGAGLALVVAALGFSLDPFWALVGLLLFWAGIVKVIVAALWRNLGAGDPAPAPRDR